MDIVVQVRLPFWVKLLLVLETQFSCAWCTAVLKRYGYLEVRARGLTPWERIPLERKG